MIIPAIIQIQTIAADIKTKFLVLLLNPGGSLSIIMLSILEFPSTPKK